MNTILLIDSEGSLFLGNTANSLTAEGFKVLKVPALKLNSGQRSNIIVQDEARVVFTQLQKAVGLKKCSGNVSEFVIHSGELINLQGSCELSVDNVFHLIPFEVVNFKSRFKHQNFTEFNSLVSSISSKNISVDHKLLKTIEVDLGHAEKSEILLRHKVQALANKSWFDEIIDWFRNLFISITVILSLLFATVICGKASCIILNKVRIRNIKLASTEIELSDSTLASRLVESLEARIVCIEKFCFSKADAKDCPITTEVLDGIIGGIIEKSGIDCSKLNSPERTFIERVSRTWQLRK